MARSIAVSSSAPLRRREQQPVEPPRPAPEAPRPPLRVPDAFVPVPRAPVALGPVSAPAPLTPAETELAARFARVAAAQSAADAAWASLPPDARAVTLPASTPSDLVLGWQAEARALRGPGDAEKLDRFLADNDGAMESLARVLLGRAQAPDQLLGVHYGEVPVSEQYLAGAVAALQALHPGAQVELAVSSERPGEPLLALTEAGATRYLAVDPSAVSGPGQWRRFRDAVTRDAALADAWNAAVGRLAPDLARPSAAATLDALSWRPTDVGLRALLSLPPAQLGTFLSALSASGSGVFAPVEVAPQSIVVRSGLGAGDAVTATVDISAAAAEIGKRYQFLEQNTAAVLGPLFTQYLELRTDAPRTLGSPSLLNEVGAAMQLLPDHLPATAADEALFQDGQWPLYGGATEAVVGPIARQLEAQAGTSPVSVTVLPLVYHASDGQQVQLPLFRVSGPGGEERFVDNLGRGYRDFDDWLEHNELPPGRMTFPSGGHLRADAAGRPLIETVNTPQTVDTVWEHVLGVADTAALVGGVVVGAAVVIGTGGVALPIVAAGLAGYGALRSGGELVDRARHGQSLDPLHDAQARSEWLNLGSSVLGLAAMGASSRVVQQVAGFVGRSGQAVTAAGALSVISQTADTAAIVDQGAQLALHWDELSVAERAQAVSQLAFWGGMLGVQARGAGGLKNLYSARAVSEALRQAHPRPLPESPSVAQALAAGAYFRVDPQGPVETSVYTREELLVAEPGQLTTGNWARVMGARFIGPEARTDGDFRYAYGEESFRAFVRADNRLLQIPTGQLAEQLDLDLLQELSRLSYVPGQEPLAEQLAHGFRALQGRTIESGRLRDYTTRSMPFGPLSAGEIAALEANGVRWSPSPRGDGWGAIVYPPPETVRPQLEALLAETRAALADPDTDVVALAAGFTQRFVALHPFQDGNGRVARLVADRLLVERGYPAALLESPGTDLTLTREAYTQALAEGITRMNASLAALPRANFAWARGLFDARGAGLQLPLPEVRTVELGGMPFALGQDGFVYDMAGRPHLAGPDGALRPMSQLEYYATVRRLAQQPGARAALEGYTAPTRALFDRYLADPALASATHVASDRAAIAADSHYELLLGPSGNGELVALFDLSQVPPANLFAPTEPGVSPVTFALSRYQQLDLELWHVQRALTAAGDTAGAAQLMDHRSALFDQAKQYVKTLPRHDAQATYEQLAWESSPLRFDSLAEKIRLEGDDTILLWRGDSATVQYTGVWADNAPFRPDAFANNRLRASRNGTVNLLQELRDVSAASGGTGWQCYTTDPALLADADFASKSSLLTVPMSALPAPLRRLLEPRLAAGPISLRGLRDLLHLPAAGSNPGHLDLSGAGAETLSSLRGLLPEAQRGIFDARVAQALAPASGLTPWQRLFAPARWVKVDDLVPPAVVAQLAQQLVSADLVTLSLSGGTLEVTVHNRAFLIEVPKAQALPGLDTLGGVFEGEQEVSVFRSVPASRVLGTWTAQALRAPVPAP